MSYKKTEEGGEVSAVHVDYFPDARSDRRKCCALILAVVCPPLGVLMVTTNPTQFLIDLVLTLLGWLPGVFYAVYVIFFQPDQTHF